MKWLLINLGGLLLSLLPEKAPAPEPELEFKWDAFADCGCRYFYKEMDGKGVILVTPCDDNSIIFWEERELSWFDFNMYARDEGHAYLSIM